MTTIAESERSWQKGKSPSFPLSFTKMHYQSSVVAVVGGVSTHSEAVVKGDRSPSS